MELPAARPRVTCIPERLRLGMPFPEGAVRLSRMEVVLMHKEIVEKWQPQSETWPFKYGQYILTTGTSISGLVALTIIRRRFNVVNYSRFSSMIFAMVVPAVTTLFLHQVTIDDKIFAVDFKCPECIKLRSGLIHGSMGAIYPPLVAGIFSMLICRQKKTYLIYGRKFVPNVAMLGKTFISMKYAIASFFFFNFLIGSAVAHFKMESLLHILTTLREDVVQE